MGVPSLSTPAERVVVVGGGANGTWVSVHLARQAGIEEIVLVDRFGRHGRGVAYSTGAACHRLNVPASRMGGADSNDTDGFAQWLLQSGALDNARREDSFVPRHLYGDYLCEQLGREGAGVKIKLLRDEALSVRQTPKGYAVTLASGTTIISGSVVLCPGNPAPGKIRGIENGPRLIPDVWAPAALDPIGPQDDVAIIGTGATAIDAVLDLVQRDKACRIRMISRHGKLPLTDVTENDCDPLDDVYGDTVACIMGRLRAAVAARAAHGIPWQAVVDVLRARSGEIWLSLSDQERRRFLRHLRGLWLVHRHRLAPDVAEHLARLHDQGRIEIIPARVLGGIPTSKGYALRIRRRGAFGAEPEKLEADWVINCTGPDEHYARSENPLIASLIGTGLARVGPHGLGLDCDLQHRIVNAEGQSMPGLYLAGPPTRGRFWEVTSAPSGRDQCVEIAGHIALKMARAEPPHAHPPEIQTDLL